MLLNVNASPNTLIRCHVNHQQADTIAVNDRGVLYGDGIFRTVYLRAGEPSHWRWQWYCFQRDAARLRLQVPDEAAILADFRVLAAELPEAVARVTLTRGVGERGYRFPPDAHSTVMVQVSPWTGYAASWYEGIHLDWSPVVLSEQPLFAGVKHLNRLENVWARQLCAETVHDVLLCNAAGCVIESSMANVFIVENGRWVTPDLSSCGVSGAVRLWLSEGLAARGEGLAVEAVDRTRILAADEVWLGNSLLGLAAVARLVGREWKDWPCGRLWSNAWCESAFS